MEADPTSYLVTCHASNDSGKALPWSKGASRNDKRCAIFMLIFQFS
jgi:hypothetical protein